MISSIIRVAFTLFLTAAAHVHAQPVISVSDSSLAFGDVYRDQKVTRDVFVFNRGNSDLNIRSVDSPCGCTTTNLEKYNIPPGDSSRLSILINTSILLGNVHKYVLVVSNDLSHRNLIVRYAMNVITILDVTPPYLYLGDIDLNKDATGQLMLRNSGKKPVHILKASSRSGKLILSPVPGIMAPGDSILISVKLNLGEPVTFKDEIRLETDAEAQPMMRISVIARGKGK
jgi:hypothetical protein